MPYPAHLSIFPILTPFRQQGCQTRLSPRTNGDHSWPGPLRDLTGLPNWPPLVSPTVANTTHSTRQEQRSSRPTGPLRLGRGALVRYSCMGPLEPYWTQNWICQPWSPARQHGTAHQGTAHHITAHQGTAQQDTLHSKAQPGKAQRTAQHSPSRHSAHHSTAQQGTSHSTARHGTTHHILGPFWASICKHGGPHIHTRTTAQYVPTTRGRRTGRCAMRRPGAISGDKGLDGDKGGQEGCSDGG